MSYKYIELSHADRVAKITMNRPEKRNALDFEFISELKDAFNKLEKDSETRVIILTGKEKAFSAGADLAYLQSLQSNSYEENLEDSRHLKELFEIIYFHSKPVIALINGHAIAGGCGLATVADFSFSIPEAKFCFSEVKIGFIPAIIMIFVLRKIGEARGKQLLLSGELFEAEKAKEYGLINDVHDRSKIDIIVDKFARDLANSTSSQSIAATKRMIAEISSMPIKDALEYAAIQNAKARSNDDCKKGISNFLNKQDLNW